MAQTPSASYTLNGTYDDSLGGPSLVSHGGTLGPTGYSFDPNQGLSLLGVIDQTNYSIELVFRVDNVDVAKIIDFNDLMSDSGYYTGNTAEQEAEGNLMFFDTGIGPILGPGKVLQNGVDAHLVVTRDGTTGEGVAYVNCVEHIRFNTVSGTEATFVNNLARFFIDDPEACEDQCESSAGFVDYINIYSGPLTQSEVTILAEDTDCDGVNDNNDICPDTPAGDPVDANGCSDEQLDIDHDGVLGADDYCPNTVIPESVPTFRLKPNHWALIDGSFEITVNFTQDFGENGTVNGSFTAEDGDLDGQILYSDFGGNADTVSAYSIMFTPGQVNSGDINPFMLDLTLLRALSYTIGGPVVVVESGEDSGTEHFYRCNNATSCFVGDIDDIYGGDGEANTVTSEIVVREPGTLTFDTVSVGVGNGPGRNYNTSDTAGCSCEQIIEIQGLGDGHSNHGCSISAMDDWLDLVN
jgi:hypothetical protein